VIQVRSGTDALEGKRAPQVWNFYSRRPPWYIRRLNDETDEYRGLRSSVTGFCTEEYSSVIFLGTEEYNKT
jgi:hypothetical protein